MTISSKLIILGFLSLALRISVSAQTLYVPNGANGVGVSSNGNVGIGISNPNSKLQIVGDLYISQPSGSSLLLAYGANTGVTLTDQTSYVYLRPYHALNGDMPLQIGPGVGGGIRIDTAGRVGIGTTSPAAPLHVFKSDGDELMRLEAVAPYVYFKENGLTAPAGRWRLVADGGTIRFDRSTSGEFSSYASDLLISDGGNVGIGTTSPTHRLSVNGTIRAKEVIVDTGWADHVFETGYRLAPLSEVEQHIQQNGHLPDVPSAADVAARGVSVGEMQKILLQKIEELTLHQIEQEKRLNAQADRIRALETENAQLRTR